MLTHPPATIAWDGKTLAMAVPDSQYKGFKFAYGMADGVWNRDGGWNREVERNLDFESTKAMFYFADAATGEKMTRHGAFTDDHMALFHFFQKANEHGLLPEGMFFYAAFVTQSFFTTMAIRGGENSLTSVTNMDRNGPLRRDPRGSAVGYSETMMSLLLGQGFSATDAVQMVIAEQHGSHDPAYHLFQIQPFETWAERDRRVERSVRIRSSDAYWKMHDKTQRTEHPCDATDPLGGALALT